MQTGSAHKAPVGVSLLHDRQMALTSKYQTAPVGSVFFLFFIYTLAHTCPHTHSNKINFNNSILLLKVDMSFDVSTLNPEEFNMRSESYTAVLLVWS